MSAMEELKVIADAVKAKKGRMDAQEKERSAHLIASVWSDDSSDPAGSLSLMEQLQSEVIADGMRRIWSSLSPDRRGLFTGWLPGPKSEKASRRIALLAASILEMDGITALSWLSRLTPHGAKAKISRELGDIVVGSFWSGKPIRITPLAGGDTRAQDLLRVVNVLLQVAVDDRWAVELMARYRLVEDILTIIWDKNLNLANEWAPVSSRIEIEVKRWPQVLIRQLNQALGQRFPEGQSFFNQILPVRDAVFPSRVQGQVAEDLRSKSQTALGAAGDAASITSRLDEHIAALSAQIENLRAVANLLAQEQRAHEEADKKLRDTEARESSLDARVKRLSEELEQALAKLKEVNIHIETSERANRLSRENLEAERDRLKQQIAANAAGRVEEFKNNLALVLARLIRDLPGKDEQLSAEVANIVFLQFHQFLDALDGQGIKIRRSRGAL